VRESEVQRALSMVSVLLGFVGQSFIDLDIPMLRCVAGERRPIGLKSFSAVQPDGRTGRGRIWVAMMLYT
jgi:hypothetical protein